MPMRPKQLLEACEEILKSFDPRICTVDAHVEEKLGDCSSEVRRLRVAAVRSGGVLAKSTPGIALLTVLHPCSLPHITRMPIQTKYSYSRCSTAVYATRRPSRCAHRCRAPYAPRCRFIKPPGHCSTAAVSEPRGTHLTHYISEQRSSHTGVRSLAAAAAAAAAAALRCCATVDCRRAGWPCCCC